MDAREMTEMPRTWDDVDDGQASASAQAINGMAIWISNLARAASRRQVLTSVITYLEVILPPCWTLVYLSSKGHPVWMSRAVEGPSDKSPWGPKQFLILGKWARQAAANRQLFTANTSPSLLQPGSPERTLGILFVMPLIIQNRTHGVLAVVDEQHLDQHLTSYEKGLLTLIGTIIAFALDRAELAKINRALLAASHRPGKVRIRSS